MNDDDMTFDEFQSSYGDVAVADGADFQSYDEEDGWSADPYGEAFDEYDEGGDLEMMLEDGIDEWGFLKKIARGVKKAVKTVAPIAKALAPIAGKAIGAAFGGPAGAMLGGKLGGLVSNLEDGDGFDAYEDGEDSEDEMDAWAAFPPDAADEEAAHKLADASAKTRNPATAGALAAASAATMAAKAPPKVKAVMPTVASASANVAQVMSKAKGGAVLKKALPTIQGKTVATLTAKAAKGKAVTPATAKRVMAKQTAKVLRSQGELTKAIARNEVKRRSLDKKAVLRAEGYDAY